MKVLRGKEWLPFVPFFPCALQAPVTVPNAAAGRMERLTHRIWTAGRGDGCLDIAGQCRHACLLLSKSRDETELFGENSQQETWDLVLAVEPKQGPALLGPRILCWKMAM